MKTTDVRQQLVDALQLDLVGPTTELGSAEETLAQAPSRWYLTGFLVPTEAGEEQRIDPTSDDELDQAAEPAGLDDDRTPEPAAARRSYLPSSMGLSVLLPAESQHITAVVSYGDYIPVESKNERSTTLRWQRIPRQETVTINLTSQSLSSGNVSIPNDRGLEIAWSMKTIPEAGVSGILPAGTRNLSVFLVNKRRPAADEVRDQGFVFQAQLELQSDQPFVPRPNLRSLESEDWDERVADLQYRGIFEFAVGHNVSTTTILTDGQCRSATTCWLPQAEVERVAPAQIDGVELGMEELAAIKDGQQAQELLGQFVVSYRDWINQQSTATPISPERRAETSAELIRKARIAADRIEAGIELLKQPDCLEAFRVANRAMAAQGRRRLASILKKSPEEIIPAWRPFQLAFLLMRRIQP